MKRLLATPRWLLLTALAVGGALGAGVVWWALHSHGVELRTALDAVLGQVRGLGPVAFFGLMALLPAVGSPISVFTLTAGPLFSPTLGLPLVVALALVSLAVNQVLTYALARWLFRPGIEWLCTRLGFALPKVAEADQRSLILLVRVTPGTPFIVQNYLLGLARVAFPSYLAISWVVNSLQCGAMIVCGDALAQGQGKGVMLAVSLLVAFAVGVRWLRQYLQRRKLLAAA